MSRIILSLLVLLCFSIQASGADVTLQAKSPVRIVSHQDGTFHVSCPTPESYRAFWLGWLSNFNESERGGLMNVPPFADGLAHYETLIRCDARVFPIVAPKLIDHLLNHGYSVVSTDHDLNTLGYSSR